MEDNKDNKIKSDTSIAKIIMDTLEGDFEALFYTVTRVASHALIVNEGCNTNVPNEEPDIVLTQLISSIGKALHSVGINVKIEVKKVDYSIINSMKELSERMMEQPEFVALKALIIKTAKDKGIDVEETLLKNDTAIN